MLRMILISSAVLAFAILPLRAADNGLKTVPSANSAKATLAKLDKAIKARGLKVFTHIDHAAAAKEFGTSMPPATVVVFGNPKGGTPNFLKQPTLAIDLPLKMLVWENADGKAFVSYNSGSYVFGTIFGRHGLKPPPAVAKGQEKMLNGLATSAAK
ncbi:MAG: DUF302 domain-containing protein [Hyphomicrobiaceae bacterium]